MWGILLVLVLWGLVQAQTYQQTQKWFHQQRVNHFASFVGEVDEQVFSQRYFEITQYWKPPHGPVILHICGEYTCRM